MTNTASKQIWQVLRSFEQQWKKYFQQKAQDSFRWMLVAYFIEIVALVLFGTVLNISSPPVWTYAVLFAFNIAVWLAAYLLASKWLAAGQSLLHLGYIISFAFLYIFSQLRLELFILLSALLYLPLLLLSFWSWWRASLFATVFFVIVLGNIYHHLPYDSSLLVAVLSMLTILCIAIWTQHMRLRAIKDMLKAHQIFQNTQKRLHIKEQQIQAQTQQLIEQQNLLRSILNSAHDIAIWVINNQYELIEFNHTFSQSQIHACSARQLSIGTCLLDAITEADQRQKWKQRYDQALQGNSITFYEHCQESDEKYYEVTCTPVYGHRERVRAVVVFAKDITHMRKSGLLLNAIVNSSPNGIFVLDRHGHYLMFNETHRERMRKLLKQEPAVGISFFSLIPNQHGERQLLKQTLQYIAQGQSIRKEFFFNWQEEVHVEMIATPLLSEENYFLGVAVFIRDLTQQRKQEKQILEQEKLLRSINQHLQAGIYRCTQDGRFLYANQGLVQLLGFQNVNQLFAHYTHEFIVDKARSKALIDKVMEQGHINNEEIQLRRIDGSLFWALLNVSCHREADGFIFDGSLHDITALKEARERLIRQNEELQKVNQELDHFVYSASHDLKAPLSSIQGIIQVARLEKEPQAVFAYLDLIERSVGRLERFIRDIIHYSRNARIQPQAECIDFRQIVQEVFEDMSHLPQASCIERIIHIDTPYPFFSDAHRISIILNNLISNALIYYNRYADSPYVRLQIQTSSTHAIIICEDNGIGIAPEHIDKIFGMFYRASADSKGSGLGLYIVKEAIEKLGGSIGVVSTLGKGSCFTVKLPNLKSQQST